MPVVEIERSNGKAGAVGPTTNDSAALIEFQQPYMVDVRIEGTSAMLFHRWSCEDVAEQAAAPKGSRAKKSDNVESYVYRNDEGIICLPGEYVRQAMCNAAKRHQDPSSPRKSARDLYLA